MSLSDNKFKASEEVQPEQLIRNNFIV